MVKKDPYSATVADDGPEGWYCFLIANQDLQLHVRESLSDTKSRVYLGAASAEFLEKKTQSVAHIPSLRYLCDLSRLEIRLE